MALSEEVFSGKKQIIQAVSAAAMSAAADTAADSSAAVGAAAAGAAREPAREQEKEDAKGRIIAVCDPEVGYACRLMEYLRGRGAPAADIRVYSSLDKFRDLTSPDDVALLIVAESEFRAEDVGKAAEEVLVLNESDSYLGEEIRNVSKYQSMEIIVSTVFGLCPDEALLKAAAVRHGKPPVRIGIYSPLGRCLNTTFSLTLGEILARSGEVLYLGFEPFSPVPAFLGQSFEGSITELLYFNDCARHKLPARLREIRISAGGVDLLPPAGSLSDLQDIRAEQWCSLLDSITKMTDYEYVILDLSDCVRGLMKILRECDEVYTITRTDRMSKAKLEEYERQLGECGYEDIRLKTRWTQLPVFDALPAAAGQMSGGPLADYIRRMRT